MSDIEKRLRELAAKTQSIRDNLLEFNEEELKEIFEQFKNVEGILTDLEEIQIEEAMVANQDSLTQSVNDIIKKVSKDE